MSQLEKHGKGIILMHDLHRNTAEAPPELIHQLKAGGYRVVHMVLISPRCRNLTRWSRTRARCRRTIRHQKTSSFALFGYQQRGQGLSIRGTGPD
jgi:hypothetical protein